MLGAIILIATGAYALQEIAKAYYKEKIRAQDMLLQRDIAIMELLDRCSECECSTCPVKLARNILEENMDALPVIIDHIDRNACEYIHLQLTKICPTKYTLERHLRK